MTAFLLALLGFSLLVACVLLVSVMPRFRRGMRRRRTVQALGAAQLLIGGLWTLWGLLYLGAHGKGSAAGWYATILGLLWAVQALRRLAWSTRLRG